MSISWPTILVHEAYARMMGEGKTAAYSDLTHFKAVAARAMRQVLLNHARDRNARKRGGGEERDRVSLSGLADEADRVLGVLQVHEALARLAELDERQARIAEYRLFAGLEHQEIADALGVSIRTVELDWKMAKLQLADWLELPV
ncbi:MAG: ECF-type sigma factor [Planctomycetota bacterium]